MRADASPGPSRHAGPLAIHLVGSLPLPDAATVFRKLAAKIGARARRFPDGETGIRRSWIRFLQDVLAEHEGLEVAPELAPFRFVQWDGRLVREIPRLRRRGAAALDPRGFRTGYAETAIDSWRELEALKRAGVVPEGVRFQVSLPTPVAPTYNNLVPADRPAVLEALTAHFIGELETIAQAVPHEALAIQWDVCQEVLAWEGYYEPGPVDFRAETLAVLGAIGDAVPAGVELGYHFCYGSPADEHIVQPADTRVMVDIANATAARLERTIDFVHMPVPKARDDDAYFAPLAELALDAGTELYAGLIHYDDAVGDARRLAAARRFAQIDGIATECGMARGDSSRLDALLDAHVALVEHDAEPGTPTR